MDDRNIIKTLDKLETLPLEYGVLIYMVTKELILTNYEKQEELKNSSNNYMLIELIVMMLVDFQQMNTITDMGRKKIIISSLRKYIDAGVSCNKDNIGLDDNEFNTFFTVFLFNLVHFRLHGMYSELFHLNRKQFNLKVYNTIAYYLFLIKNKEHIFQKYICEYREALKDYSQILKYGFDFQEEPQSYYFDDFSG